VKFWWFADYIQYDNQRKLQKKASPILFRKNSRPADSFISKNEGMNEPATGREDAAGVGRYPELPDSRRDWSV
jgi:hypothetical protein